MSDTREPPPDAWWGFSLGWAAVFGGSGVRWLLGSARLAALFAEESAGNRSPAGGSETPSSCTPRSAAKTVTTSVLGSSILNVPDL